MLRPFRGAAKRLLQHRVVDNEFRPRDIVEGDRHRAFRRFQPNLAAAHAGEPALEAPSPVAGAVSLDLRRPPPEAVEIGGLDERPIQPRRADLQGVGSGYRILHVEQD